VFTGAKPLQRFTHGECLVDLQRLDEKRGGTMKTNHLGISRFFACLADLLGPDVDFMDAAARDWQRAVEGKAPPVRLR
jgi:hypothetical protein